VELHVRILAWLNIVLGTLGVLIALFILVFFGGMARIASADPNPDEQAGAAVLGIVGVFVFIVLATVSIPSVIAGIGLLKFRSWAQILTIIVSVLSLLQVPFGTALGIYGLWVMLNKDTKPLFKPA
jgi:uncharacterized membrane protein